VCGNSLQQFGSGLEPDPEPTMEYGPVANTMPDYKNHIVYITLYGDSGHLH